MNPSSNINAIFMIEIKCKIGIKFIQSQEILYVEAANKHSIIYTATEKRIETLHLLKWYEDKLLEPTFLRVHDSFIINCQYVDYINYKHIILIGNIKIPISRYRKCYFKNNLEKFFNSPQS